MVTKECFKCRETKAITEFYKHPRMADGHLNKCMECAKSDMRIRNLDPEARIRMALYDKQRAQTNKRKAISRQSVTNTRRYNPTKDSARRAVSNALRSGKMVKLPCQKCGTSEDLHAHHSDYSKPLLVTWLCRQHHVEIHGHKMRLMT